MRIPSQLAGLVVVAAVLCAGGGLRAADGQVETAATKMAAVLAPLTTDGSFVQSAIGVTRMGTVIPCLYGKQDLNPAVEGGRVLIVGGLDGSDVSVRAATGAAAWFASSEAAPYRHRFRLTVVPVGNPDGWAQGTGSRNASGGTPGSGYPARGPFYQSATNPEAQYLWQWTGLHAPDLVIDVRAGAKRGWLVPLPETKTGKQLATALGRLVQQLPAGGAVPQGDFASGLMKAPPAGTGLIPAVRVTVTDDDALAGNGSFLAELLEQALKAGGLVPSPARAEILTRRKRTALEVAGQLARRYGHDLKSVQYIPALALVGRVRLGGLTEDDSHLADVRKIAAPWLDGSRDSLAGRVSGSTLSGHLIFAELANATGERQYVAPVLAAAGHAFDESGKPREAMPFHSEMSDAVFMGCPILAEAARLTGEERYEAACLRHLRFMVKLNVRKDGLHRHSPLDETAWGRGNGFPALGLAMSLEALPADAVGREEILAAFRAHLRAMLRYQDPTGMWHQVVDHPESYREFSCTAMTTYALIRGLRRGWLEAEEFAPTVARAWPALLDRIAPDGTLVDMCTGTGKQKNLRAYYERGAIHGPDARGGAMGLMVTTEMAAWQREQAADDQ